MKAINVSRVSTEEQFVKSGNVNHPEVKRLKAFIRSLLKEHDLSLIAELEAMKESLSELEHTQWAHWTQYMLDNLTPQNMERWRKQIETPYDDLSEKEKDSDRKWSQKALDLIIYNLRERIQ